MVEDRAAKDFRSAIRGRMEIREQKNASKFVYMTSAALVIMVLAIGISAMNNYEKMNMVQESIATLSESVKRVESETSLQNPVVEIQETDSEETKEEEKEEKGMEPKISTIQEELDKEKKEYYIVEKGDTLDTISKKIYGTTSQTDAICKMNGLNDGNLIFIGQKLLLP
jgi:nucleoid-associated protein YgaU